MTDEEIIKLACNCGAMWVGRSDYDGYEFTQPDLIAFARLIAKRQRIIDAKICESQSDLEYATGKVDHNERSWCDHLAATILAQEE